MEYALCGTQNEPVCSVMYNAQTTPMSSEPCQLISILKSTFSSPDIIIIQFSYRKQTANVASCI